MTIRWLVVLLIYVDDVGIKMEFDGKFPATLLGFGYGFNDNGILKKIDKETGKLTENGFNFEVSKDHSYNQLHYEALGEVITEEVYKLLEENGLERIHFPENGPIKEAGFIFSTKRQPTSSDKLLILIHGSGVVRAGQWSRSLIINHSLDVGSHLPYIKKARELGYEVVAVNANDNYRLIDGKKVPIPGSEFPSNHVQTIMKKFILKCNPTSVAIVAHSYGGQLTVSLVKKFPDFFKKAVFAIGFTDSVHAGLSKSEAKILLPITRHWVTSEEPLNTELGSASSHVIPRFSAGHTKHEWTSASCMVPLFEFLEEKYLEHVKNKVKK